MDAGGHRSALVDVVREYIGVHEKMSNLFALYRSGELVFEEVASLCDDKVESPLFRLKERCHALFRDAVSESSSPMRKEALFDLAVGSLFHEAMKFRENFYQQVVYAPKVRALRDADGEGDDELFREFERMLEGTRMRMDEALTETEALLAHTGEQLRVLLSGRRSALIGRYLIGQRERVDSILPGGLDALMVRMFGSLAEAYVAAAESWLASAHFRHAIDVLDEARRLGVAGPESDAVVRLEHYARGMRAFLAGDYGESLDELEVWVDTRERSGASDATRRDEVHYASLARSAVSRIDGLVEGEHAQRIRERSAELALRMAPLVESAGQEQAVG